MSDLRPFLDRRSRGDLIIDQILHFDFSDLLEIQFNGTYNFREKLR